MKANGVKGEGVAQREGMKGEGLIRRGTEVRVGDGRGGDKERG